MLSVHGEPSATFREQFLIRFIVDPNEILANAAVRAPLPMSRASPRSDTHPTQDHPVQKFHGDNRSTFHSYVRDGDVAIPKFTLPVSRLVFTDPRITTCNQTLKPCMFSGPRCQFEGRISGHSVREL